jgi:hypothetical protein
VEGDARRAVPWALGGYAVTLVLLGVIGGQGDRLPLPAWVFVGVVSAHVGVGFLLGRWPWALLGVCVFGSGVAGAAATDNLLWAAFGLVIAVPVAAALLALGIGLRKLHDRRRRLARVPLIAVAAVAPLALAVGVAVVEHNRTVRVDRTRPVPIDERSGRVGDVGLGDPAARVETRLGRAPVRDDAEGVEPLDSDGSLGSPSSMPGPPSGRDRFLRYPKSSYWIGNGRVWSIETIDPAARTSRGVGVGDSMKLVERAYPEMRCLDDSIGSDEPTPFPSCSGRTGPKTWIHFGGDYTKPGTPVTSITLLPRPIY